MLIEMLEYLGKERCAKVVPGALYYAGALAGCTVLLRVSCNQVMCENSSDTSHQFFSSTYTNR